MNKKKKNKNKKDFQLNLRHVKLSKESKKQLKKIKDSLWGNIANAIESGNWHVPSDTYEFIDVKTNFEKSMHEFFSIPKDILVEIDYYESNIMSFEKGIHPKWHK